MQMPELYAIPQEVEKEEGEKGHLHAWLHDVWSNLRRILTG